MNHNPQSTSEPVDAGIVALLPYEPKEAQPTVKPRVMGPYVPVIREPGRPDVKGPGLPDPDAALQWAYGYMGLRGAQSNTLKIVYREGTTVHIGALIFYLAGRILRPLGNRRVLGKSQTGPSKGNQ